MSRPNVPLRRRPVDPGRIMHAVAAAEQSEYAAGLVAADSDAHANPGELATLAARNLVHAMRVQDWAVVAERERGTPWDVIAASLRCPEDALRERYEADVLAWLDGADEAPEQPGAPGGLTTVTDGLRVVADAAVWLGGWLARRASLDGCPLPARTEAATRR